MVKPPLSIEENSARFVGLLVGWAAWTAMHSPSRQYDPAWAKVAASFAPERCTACMLALIMPPKNNAESVPAPLVETVAGEPRKKTIVGANDPVTLTDCVVGAVPLAVKDPTSVFVMSLPPHTI